MKYEMKKGSIWAYTVLLAFVVGVMIFIAKCSNREVSPFADDFAKAKGDTIDVGIMLNPTIYYPQGDSIVGRDYEILQRISQEHGIPMKFHPFVPLNHAMDYLDKGLYDVVVASMPLTSDLKEKYLMTAPVYTDREVLVQRLGPDSLPPITSQIQLAGDTLWVADLSPIAHRIANLAAEIGDSIHVKSSSAYTGEHLVMLVAQGVIDKAVVNERIAAELKDDYPNIDISTPISFTQFQSWALNKNNQALADSLNVWLKSQSLR